MGRALDDLMAEREAFAKTAASLDAQAPAGCGEWTASELAVHLATGELLGAVPNAPFRWLVGRGVRLDWMAPTNARALTFHLGRHDRVWALARLARPIPRLHRVGSVAATSLLEFWAHHEDVLGANDLGPCPMAVDLGPVVKVLVRYQHRALDRHAVRVTSAGTVWHEPATLPNIEVDGAAADVARWLSGRGTLSALTVLGASASADALADEVFHI